MKPAQRLERRKLKALSNAIHALYQPVAPDDHPLQVIRTLETVVSADHISYTEFLASGEVRVVKSTPFDHELRYLPLFQAHIHENPLAVPFFQGSLASARRVTDAQPLSEYRNTTIFNEFYQPLDSEFQMACNVRARAPGGGIAGLAVNRRRRDFSDEELFLFDLLMPHARRAHDLCHALDAALGTASALGEAVGGDQYGVVCFTEGYRVRLVNRLAEELSSALFHCRPRAGLVLPDRLLHCVLQLKGEAGELPGPPLPKILHLDDGAAVRLQLAPDPAGANHCLLFERQRLAARPEQLVPLGLTRRETEVAFWTLRRKTNWEIGRILGVSDRTVAKHLENLFAKLGVASRAELHARVRETCGVE